MDWQKCSGIKRSYLAPSDAILFQEGVSVKLRLPQPFRLPGVTFFCISDTLVSTTYLVDTTLSNSSDSDQTVQAVRLQTTK
ncbi:hypothetical protein [Shigella boydii]|uniref:hypothetical protein n=1 Tax=Shigella boydii TaxID=621 RepID=UPI002879C389|nr:hypothetical protein [Shigella boydii]MDS1483081.1 hypothetical protein [Shigella boydii]